MKIDDVTINIISKLLKDGRVSHQTMAKELNFSRPAIHQRVNKLELEGVIKGYTADIDFHKIGLTIDVFMFVNIHTLDYNEVISDIISLSCKGVYIQEVYRITGNKCVLIRLKATSTDKLREFHDNILKLKGLVETNTMLVLQSEKNEFSEEYINITKK